MAHLSRPAVPGQGAPAPMPTPSVARLFGPDRLAQFLAQDWGVSASHWRATSGERPFELSWNDINDMLASHRLAYPRVRLSRAGMDLAPDDFMRTRTNRRGETLSVLDPAGLHRCLGEGAALVIDAVDEMLAPVRHLADDMESVFGAPVKVNAYAGWREAQGFDTHWDDHDVLVLQVQGHKAWRVFAPTHKHPTHRDRSLALAPPDVPPLLEPRLAPGDLLYIPRGWWHDARPVGEPTLHLTFGLAPPTGLDWVAGLIERLNAHEVFRQDLPQRAPHAVQQAHLASLRAVLHAELDRLGIDTTEPADGDRNPRGRRPSLPWAVMPEHSPLAADDRIVWQLPAATWQTGEDELVLRADGRQWTFTAEVAPLLAALRDGADLSLHGLAQQMATPGLGADELGPFVLQLAAEGLVSIIAAPQATGHAALRPPVPR